MEKSSQLFPQFSPCRWFRDETLYSLCSRHHRVAGNVSSVRTALELFGPSPNGSRNLGGLSALSNRAFGQLCDANIIIDDRTLHPFYQAFMSAASSARIREAMLSGTLGGLRQALNCDFGGSKPRHALRACLECAKEDIQTHLVAYWHRDHQWPGMYRCCRHGTALFEVVHRPMPERGLAWLLPSIEAMEDAITTTAALIGAPVAAESPAGCEARDQPSRRSALLNQQRHGAAYFIPAPLGDDDFEVLLRRHSAMALAIGRHGHRIQFEEWLLAEVYRTLLARCGPLSSTQVLTKGATAAEQLQSFAKPLQRLQDFTGVLETKEQADEAVRRMLRPKRMPRSPVWHLLAMTWLAGDWNTFLRQYEAIALLRRGQRPSEQWNKPLSL